MFGKITKVNNELSCMKFGKNLSTSPLRATAPLLCVLIAPLFVVVVVVTQSIASSIRYHMVGASRVTYFPDFIH